MARWRYQNLDNGLVRYLIIYAGGEKAGSIDDMKSKTDVVQQLKQLLKLREKARTIFKNI